MRPTLFAAATILLLAMAAPTPSHADAVGAAFGAGTGLVVAGPPRPRRGRPSPLMNHGCATLLAEVRVRNA